MTRDGKLSPPLTGVPRVFASGQGGLLDVTTHPQFAKNGLVYWSYAGGDGSAVGTEVARGRLTGNAAQGYKLDDVEVIFRQKPKLSSVTIGPGLLGALPTSTPTSVRCAIAWKNHSS